MLLFGFILLFFLCGSSVKSQTSQKSTQPQQPEIKQQTTETPTTELRRLSPLQLVAKPDYPVAAGQRISLRCSALSKPLSVTWSWQRQQNQTWQEVSDGMELTLTEPGQSGLYRCCAQSGSQRAESPGHTVFIISMQATVAENLGVAAFFISLLALIIVLALLFWLHWQKHGDKATASNTVNKSFSGPGVTTKGGMPETDSDRDVYMNYTSTNQAYTDLDPTTVTVDNVYSSLS